MAELRELRARNAALERREGEAEKANAEMTRQLLEQTLYGVWVNVNDRIAYINEVGARILGASDPREVVGKSVLGEIIHPDYRDIVRDRINAMDGGDSAVPLVEEKFVRVDGRAVDVDVWAMKFTYEGRPAYLVAFKDIAERKRAEEALRESEEFNRSTLDSLPMNIAVLDRSGTIVFANRSWMEFGRKNGIRSPESIGVGVNYIDVCRRARGEHSAEAPKALEGMLAVLNGELDSFEMEYPCHSPDEKRWFTMRISSIKAGAFRGIIVAHSNITLRKMFEEALADEKAQAELYLDLMGHDINNLNQIALGYLELAVSSARDEEVRELVQKPFDAIQGSSRLIDNVRKLQRAREGGLKIEPVDLAGLLAELRGQYLNVPGRDVSIDYAPCGECLVKANGLLIDIFSNLIGNAIKHSGPAKSVRIGIILERHASGGKDYCRVAIEDDGPGLSDAQKKMAFARFGLEKAAGRGLGLYLVRSLVEDFHGSVKVEDRVKGDHTQGARFVVTLPAA